MPPKETLLIRAVALLHELCFDFQLERLVRSGDINPNPGPSHDRKQAKECCVCFRNIASNRRVVHCNVCGITCHVKCANVSHLRTDSVWCCTTCQCQLQLWNELPFSNANIWVVESTENTGCEQHEARNDSNLAAPLKRCSKNTRIAYLNINSVAGFKFFELKSFIQ